MTRSRLAALGAILLVGAALRFHRLDRESLWIDEIFSLQQARMPLPALLEAARRDTHPPLHALALHWWMEGFGESETAVRSLSAALGVATLAAFFATARRLMPAAQATVAALLLACCPYHVYYSQEARNYALFVLLTVVSYGFMLDWVAGRARAGWAYAAATVLMLCTHVFGFFVWGAQLLWLGLAGPFRRRRPGLAASLPLIVIAGLGLGLIAVWMGTMLREVSAKTTGLQLERPSLRHLLVSLRDFTGSTPAALLLLPAAALEVYRGLSDADAVGADGAAIAPRSRTWLLLLWAAVPQVAPFALSQVTVPIYITRATIATLPALYLLAAAFLGPLGALARTAITGTVVAASLVAQVLYFGFPSKEQWREAAAEVDRRARPGDVAVFDAGYGRRGFDHYSRAVLGGKLALAHDLTSPEGAQELAALPADARRVWVVRFQRPPGRARVPPAFSRFRLAGFAAYQGLELYLFDRGAGGDGIGASSAQTER